SATTRTTARTDSVMFNTLNTSRPIPRPRGTVMPGARNFSGVSRKEIAVTSPNHVKVVAAASPLMSGRPWRGSVIEGDDAQAGPGERFQGRSGLGGVESSQQFGEQAL